MRRVSPLSLSDFSDDQQMDTPMPRLALAGGSDRRPPDDEAPAGAEIIRFPKTPQQPDGLRPWTEMADETPAADKRDEPESPAGARPENEPLWPHWMAHVLTRYRAPDGSSGGAGVFI